MTVCKIFFCCALGFPISLSLTNCCLVLLMKIFVFILLFRQAMAKIIVTRGS